MIKQSKIRLDVDFIGGEEPLTKEEEKAISEYLKTHKQKIKKVSETTVTLNRRKKHVA